MRTLYAGGEGDSLANATDMSGTDMNETRATKLENQIHRRAVLINTLS